MYTRTPILENTRKQKLKRNMAHMKTHENNAIPKDIRFRTILFRRKNVAIRGSSTVWSLEAPSFGDRCVDVVDELWLPRAPAADVMDAMSTISHRQRSPNNIVFSCIRLLRFNVLCLQKYNINKQSG